MLEWISRAVDKQRGIPFRRAIGKVFRPLSKHLTIPFLSLLVGLCLLAENLPAQDHEDEIVANLSGGRVIIHVASDLVIFAAIDQPIEANPAPPRVMNLDSRHIGVLLGASEWQSPADPKPLRVDRNLPHIGVRDPRYQADPSGAEPDLETMGIALLEKLRPLAAQLHHKLDFPSDEPLLEVVIIGFAPGNYGPEVWTAEFRIDQEQIASKQDYWQTRVLRPRFTQLYPPEGKHSPRTLVEVRYPAEAPGVPLAGLIQQNDPRVARLRSSDSRFSKVVENIEKGQAQKASAADSTDFLRAVVPLIAGNARFVIGTMEEQRGFHWIVEPDEPIEKVKEDKNQPPDAPTLRGRPGPP
jgi:hypothetical protein